MREQEGGRKAERMTERMTERMNDRERKTPEIGAGSNYYHQCHYRNRTKARDIVSPGLRKPGRERNKERERERERETKIYLRWKQR